MQCKWEVKLVIRKRRADWSMKSVSAIVGTMADTGLKWNFHRTIINLKNDILFDRSNITDHKHHNSIIPDQLINLTHYLCDIRFIKSAWYGTGAFINRDRENASLAYLGPDIRLDRKLFR